MIKLIGTEKVLISACLMGENVRYDGGNCLINHPIFAQLKTENRLIPFCPECAGGLTIPRAPAEKVGSLILTNTGEDVTTAFEKGAQHTLNLCKKNNIRIAILKENSPSCGPNNIYDGSFTGNKISGTGITAKLLQQNNITVLSEAELNKIST